MRQLQKRIFLVHIPLLVICLMLGLTTFGGPNHDKISPGLARMLDYCEANYDFDTEIPVIIQFNAEHYHPHGAPPGLLKAKALDLIEGHSGQMKVKEIRKLAKSKFVERISGDLTLQPTSNPFNSSVGIEQYNTWSGVQNQIGYDGENVRVVVFDSGITRHRDLGSGEWKGDDDEDYNYRFYKSWDFTSNLIQRGYNEGDGFGHGTHVAGIIGGNGQYQSAKTGIAPRVEFIDFKVLDDTGAGTTSTLIQAIEYAIKYKNYYNIKIANLSLGHPAFESYETDPLCKAVRMMVNAGIVTVVSAGNLGKTADHPEIWGGIASPGTEPSVITVGAVNTQGTITHSDDVATSYSSRGYTVPDGLFKPDLVAPGNQIASLSPDNSYLAQTYPQLLIENGYKQDYIYLSGSSMATPFVAGTAALMLEANPDLSPTQVKTLLLLSAVKMTEPHMFEQGNGFLNAYTAVKLAEAMDVQNDQLNSAVDSTWTLNAENGPETIVSGGAFIWDDRVFYSELVDVTGSFWGDGVIWADNLSDPGSVIWTDNFFDPDSVIWSDFFDGVIWADFFDGVIWADFFDGVIWADFFDGVIWADFFDGVIWADDFFDPDGVIWADSVIWGDDPANSTEGD